MERCSRLDDLYTTDLYGLTRTVRDAYAQLLLLPATASAVTSEHDLAGFALLSGKSSLPYLFDTATFSALFVPKGEHRPDDSGHRSARSDPGACGGHPFGGPSTTHEPPEQPTDSEPNYGGASD